MLPSAIVLEASDPGRGRALRLSGGRRICHLPPLGAGLGVAGFRIFAFCGEFLGGIAIGGAELLHVGLDLIFCPSTRIRRQKKSRWESLISDHSPQLNPVPDDAELFQVFESEEFSHSLLHQLGAAVTSIGAGFADGT